MSNKLKTSGLNVDVRSLKLWVSANLPYGSHLREVLLVEEDFLPTEEFLVKIKAWLKLCDLESDQIPQR